MPLYFLNSINLCDSYPHHLPFHFKKIGDDYFEEVRYWFNGRKFSYNPNQNTYELCPSKIYKTTLQKIISFIKAFIFFIPGCLLIGLSYSDAWSKTEYAGLQLFLDIEKQTISHNQAYQIACKQLPITQTQLFIVNDVIEKNVIFYLNNETLHKFAQTCQQYYCISHKERIKRKEIVKFLPFYSLLEDQLFHIPYISPQGNLLKCVASPPSYIFNEQIKKEGNFQFFKLVNRADQIFSENYPEIADLAMCKVETNKTLWFIFHLSINSAPLKEALLPFVKVKDEWFFINRKLPGYLPLLFSLFNIDNQATAKVWDYLKRLMNKEPVGVFPNDLNDPLDLDFSTLSSQAIEGPVTDSNSRPLIKLWEKES